MKEIDTIAGQLKSSHLSGASKLAHSVNEMQNWLQQLQQQEEQLRNKCLDLDELVTEVSREGFVLETDVVEQVPIHTCGN